MLLLVVLVLMLLLLMLVHAAGRNVLHFEGECGVTWCMTWWKDFTHKRDVVEGFH